MVKNIPTVERSTRIRFGKNALDDQADNTIVFNASDEEISATRPSAVYLHPVRLREDYSNKNVVLLMYDKITKEITESGEAATDIINTSLQGATGFGNVTSNICIFHGSSDGGGVSFITSNSVGIANSNPRDHTLSVGSNLFIDDVGSNILVVTGNVSITEDLFIEGNLTVMGSTSLIVTDNTSIKDAVIELGRNNTTGDVTLDLGIIFTRPESNVVIGFKENIDEIIIAYTNDGAENREIDPITNEHVNVHVYGRVFTEANVGIININPIHTLDVGSNLYVDDLASNVLVVRGSVDITDDLTVTGNVYVGQDVEVVGNVYIDGNVNVYKDLSITGNVYTTGNTLISDQLTITGNVYADQDIEVVGNVYIDGNVNTYKDLLVTGNVYTTGNTLISDQLTVTGNVYADQDVEVVGNVYIDGNVNTYNDLLVTGNVYTTGNTLISDQLTITGNVYADQDIEVVGNVYIDGNVNTYKDLLVTGNVYTTGNTLISDQLTVTGNVYADQDIEVVGNVYIDGNVNVYKDLSITGNVYTTGNTLISDQLTVTGNVYADRDIEVVGNVYIDGNVNTYKDLLVTGNVYTTGNTLISDQLTITGNVYADQDIEVVGNVYIDGNVNTYKDLLVTGNVYTTGNTLISDQLTITGNVYADQDIEVVGNVYIDGNVNTYKDLLVTGNVYTTGNTLISDQLTVTGNVYADQDIEVVGNVYIDGNVNTYKDLLVTGNVYTTGNTLISDQLTITGNVYADQDIEVVGNVYIDGNVNTYKDLLVTGNVYTTGNTLISDQLTVTGNVYADRDIEVVRNVNIGGNVSINGLTSSYFPMMSVDNKYLVNSVIRNNNDTILIDCDTQITGNLQIFGTSFTVNSENLSISDRIIDIANNNTSYSLDVGIIMEHPDHNVGIIHHGGDPNSLSVGYTSSGYGDDLIEHNVIDEITFDVRGNTLIQNNLTVVNNDLFVQNGKLGIKTVDAEHDLHVVGNAFVTSNITTTSNVLVTGDAGATSTTTGALQVAGGVGVVGEIHSGSLSAAKDQDVTSYLGRAAIGYNGTDSNEASFAHIDHNTSGSYTLKQTSSGATHINAKNGQNIKFNINNVERGKFINNGDFVVDTDTLYVDAVNDRVGIKTASPVKKLHVQTSSNEILAGLDRVTDANEQYTGLGFGLSDTSQSNRIFKGGIFFKRAGGGTGRGDLLFCVENTEDNTTEVSPADVAMTIDRFGQVTLNNNFYGPTVIGANLYGTLVGSNAATVTTLTASDVVKGPTITGTNLYGTLAGSNAATVTTLTASGVVNITDASTSINTTTGALQVTGGAGIVENLNVGGVTKVWNDSTSTSTTTGALKVVGGAGIVKNLNVGGVAKVWDDTASTSTTTGALQVAGGLGVVSNVHTKGVIAGATGVNGTPLVLNVGRGDVTFEYNTYDRGNDDGAGITIRTSANPVLDSMFAVRSSGHASRLWVGQTLTSVGSNQLCAGYGGASGGEGVLSSYNFVVNTNGDTGIGTTSPGTKLEVHGGTIINSDAVSRKTYSRTGTIANGTTAANAQISIGFAPEIFSAKITAHVVESPTEMSTMTIDVGGGHRTGGVGLSIIEGPINIFGHTNDNPWDATSITSDVRTVKFRPTKTFNVEGMYNIFVEYISSAASSGCSNIAIGSSTEEYSY